MHSLLFKPSAVVYLQHRVASSPVWLGSIMYSLNTCNGWMGATHTAAERDSCHRQTMCGCGPDITVCNELMAGRNWLICGGAIQLVSVQSETDREGVDQTAP